MKYVGNTRELAWAAGLFEGEGCIHLTRRKKPRIQLAMTDEDSVRRFHKAIGYLGGVGGPRIPKGGKRLEWRWEAGGLEQVQAVVAMLWYGLGERRRAKCVEVLTGVEYIDRTVCRNGHKRTPETYTVGGCRLCRSEASKRYRRKRKSVLDGCDSG